jgi:predicted PurR-regulated permease PerM
MPDSVPPLSDPPRFSLRTRHGTAALGQGATVAAIVIAALYFGRAVFVPLALAILLSFVLAPLVRGLRRAGLGRVPPVIAGVTLAFAIILGLGGVIGGQVTFLAENLPQYEGTIRQKIRSIKVDTDGSGLLGRSSAVLRDLANEFTGADRPAAQSATAPGLPKQQQTVPVEITHAEPTPLEIIGEVAGPLLAPLATFGLVLIFTIFILLQREDLRDRLIRLLGARDLQRTTTALDDAAERLSRYFLVQGAINATFGVIIGMGLWWIGVPNPALWGVVAAMLRFLPYIGAPLAAAFPALLAFAVAPGWSMTLWTIGLFAVVEPIMGQLVEPLLYGHSTGLSSLAVVVSAAFWTVLWGPVGLLLATPLTACLVVLGRHIAPLEFLDILLGDRPPLSPQETFYQRLVAGNMDEAAEQAEAYLRDHSLVDYYDDVVLKALALAERDAARGHFDETLLERLHKAVRALVEDLVDHEAVAGQPAPAGPNAPVGPAVLCAPARNAIDETGCDLLTQLLEKQGVPVRSVPAVQISALNVMHLEAGRPDLICLSYFGCDNLRAARYVVRRLRRRFPAAKILLGLWCLSEEENARNTALSATGADAVASSLRQALAYIAVARAGGAGRDGAAAPGRDAVARLPTATG